MKETKLKRSDIEIEIARIEYLIENYKHSDAEEVYLKNYLSSLHRYRDKIATKKEAREASA